MLAGAMASPSPGTVHKVFAFPEGYLMLDLIDDILVGGVGFLAMGRCGNHDDGRVHNGDFAEAVDGDGYL